MRYGHFDDAAKEYVIETPATPLPWINYLGNEDFFSLISNTGGGYSFYKDAKLRRITRYRYNNVPADNGSRCYYLSLMDSDSADAKPVETWSPTFLPCKTPLIPTSAVKASATPCSKLPSEASNPSSPRSCRCTPMRKSIGST